jgi:hypothetical protein
MAAYDHRERKRYGAECAEVDTVLRMPIRVLHTPEIVLLLAVMVGECYGD